MARSLLIVFAALHLCLLAAEAEVPQGRANPEDTGNCNLLYGSEPVSDASWVSDLNTANLVGSLPDTAVPGYIFLTLDAVNITNMATTTTSDYLSVEFTTGQITLTVTDAFQNYEEDMIDTGNAETIEIRVTFTCEDATQVPYGFVVTVEDINTYAPVFEASPYNYEMPMPFPGNIEVTYLYGEIIVTDIDFSTSAMTINLDDTGSQLFEQQVTRESTSRYNVKLFSRESIDLSETTEITITATDSGTPALTSSTTITITVSEEDSVPTPPQFENPVYHQTVTAEEVVANQEITTVNIIRGYSEDVTLSLSTLNQEPGVSTGENYFTYVITPNSDGMAAVTILWSEEAPLDEVFDLQYALIILTATRNRGVSEPQEETTIIHLSLPGSEIPTTTACPTPEPTTTVEPTVCPECTTIAVTECPELSTAEPTECPACTTEIPTECPQVSTAEPTTCLPCDECSSTTTPAGETPATTDCPPCSTTEVIQLTTDCPATECPDCSTTEGTQPTTECPTTECPTTECPTTDCPPCSTTEIIQLTTDCPTTECPDCSTTGGTQPTTECPTTEYPTTECPYCSTTESTQISTECPTTECPSTECPPCLTTAVWTTDCDCGNTIAITDCPTCECSTQGSTPVQCEECTCGTDGTSSGSTVDDTTTAASDCSCTTQAPDASLCPTASTAITECPPCVYTTEASSSDSSTCEPCDCETTMTTTVQPPGPSIQFEAERYTTTVNSGFTGSLIQLSLQDYDDEGYTLDCNIQYSTGDLASKLSATAVDNIICEIAADVFLLPGSYSFNVVASLVGTSSSTSAEVALGVTATVSCDDTADPVFGWALRLITVAEAQEEVQIILEGGELPDGCSYSSSVDPPQYNDWVLVNPSTGEVSVSTLDYELVTSLVIDLEILCSNQESQAKITALAKDSPQWPKDITHDSRYMTLLVQIEDVNDNAPVFTQSDSLVVGYPTRDLLSRVQPPSVISIQATDEDEGVNAEIQYSLDSAGDSYFAINSETGVIYQRSDAPDISEDITFTVTATDMGGSAEGLTSSIQIQVKPLAEEEVFIATVSGALAEDTDTIVANLSSVTGLSVHCFRTYTEPAAETSRTRRKRAVSDVSLSLVLYALDQSNEPITSDTFQSLITSSSGSSEWTVTQIETLPSVVDDNGDDNDDDTTGFLVGIIVLAVLLVLLLLAIGIVYFYYFRPILRGRTPSDGYREFKSEPEKPSTLDQSLSSSIPAITTTIVSETSGTSASPPSQNLYSFPSSNSSDTLRLDSPDAWPRKRSISIRGDFRESDDSEVNSRRKSESSDSVAESPNLEDGRRKSMVTFNENVACIEVERL